MLTLCWLLLQATKACKLSLLVKNRKHGIHAERTNEFVLEIAVADEHLVDEPDEDWRFGSVYKSEYPLTCEVGNATTRSMGAANRDDLAGIDSDAAQRCKPHQRGPIALTLNEHNRHASERIGGRPASVRGMHDTPD